MPFSVLVDENIDRESLRDKLAALGATPGAEIKILPLIKNHPIRDNKIPPNLSEGLGQYAHKWAIAAYRLHCDSCLNHWQSSDFNATIWSSMEEFLDGPIRGLLTAALERAFDIGYLLDTGKRISKFSGIGRIMDIEISGHIGVDHRDTDRSKVCADGCRYILANLKSLWRERLTGFRPAPTPLTEAESALVRYEQSRGNIPMAIPQKPVPMPMAAFELPGPANWAPRPAQVHQQPEVHASTESTNREATAASTEATEPCVLAASTNGSPQSAPAEPATDVAEGTTKTKSERKQSRDAAIREIWPAADKAINYKDVCEGMDRRHEKTLEGWPEKTWLANFLLKRQRKTVKQYIHDVIRPPKKTD